MERDNLGRFSSFKKWVKGLVIKTVQFFLIVAVVGAAMFALIMGIKYLGWKSVNATTKVELTTTPQTLDQRWEAQYKKDVELEMQRSGFKAEMDAYARAKAERNVQSAYVTKLEQKMK